MPRTILPLTLVIAILGSAIAAAQAQPSITIIQPQTGKQLTGDVEVKAKPSNSATRRVPWWLAHVL